MTHKWTHIPPLMLLASLLLAPVNSAAQGARTGPPPVRRFPTSRPTPAPKTVPPVPVPSADEDGDAPTAVPAAAVPIVSSTARSGDYLIATQDIVEIRVVDHPELTGKFPLQSDGTMQLPLVGRVRAAGLSAGALEAALTTSFADGFIRDPLVTVTVEPFLKGQRIFVFGNVASPGTYPLLEGQTLIETLVRVGYGAASEAVVLRPRERGGPTLPDAAGDAQVFRVNLRELEKDVEHGSLARNLVLLDGDTVFVPRVDPTRVFVSGQIRNPGAYSITEGTTVIQALALAGGPTETAAINRLRVMRIVEGRQRTIDVKLSDVLQPGDTLVVPERYF